MWTPGGLALVVDATVCGRRATCNSAGGHAPPTASRSVDRPMEQPGSQRYAVDALVGSAEVQRSMIRAQARFVAGHAEVARCAPAGGRGEGDEQVVAVRRR